MHVAEPSRWRHQHRLLLIDDSPAFVAVAAPGLAADGFEVVGVAAGGREGVEMAGRLLPDVVVLDIGLPDIDGFDVARLLTAERAGPVVVLTSSRWYAADDQRLAACGAKAFIVKESLDGNAVRGVLESWS